MQSGITATQELLDVFQAAVSDPSVRGLIVGIENEALVSKETLPSAGSFDEDLSQLDGHLKDNQPAYIILRRRDLGSLVAPFICIAYVPDIANVRQKMLFASTRNTLLRDLGSDRFEESIFATTKEELTAEGFKRHDAHLAKPAPLTEEEKTLKEVKEAEAEASTGASTKKATSRGVLTPVTEEALEALRNLRSGGFINLVQLAVNIEKERIELASASTAAIGDFTRVIPDDTPRYSFFIFNRTSFFFLVFIYTCPPQSKIRERMIYAASRGSVVASAEADAGLQIARRLEASSASDVSELQLLEEFHPKKEEKESFSRPKRPGRR
ncbi:unnamed protein product [Tuber melanosporum]|uniref:Twinfilin n=1 Tax=Tuber melanosporum (strain Mel28) TaxID=656061 RepID=D5GDX9_TUBMM|nr:uncharacterized protein GSTUM_00001130001 [Tuber melanosporum]CAZ82722.1 unnamed protein product [Tuber melanosporum]